jgi:hypothetical protein
LENEYIGSVDHYPVKKDVQLPHSTHPDGGDEYGDDDIVSEKSWLAWLRPYGVDL